MLWIPATLAAAAVQTARNAMQSNLTAALGTLGATQVRFIYGWPFAVLFLAAAASLAGSAVPAPTAAFLGYTAGGAVAQIAGTALLLKAMHARSFSVATAFNKTEAVQVAVFGIVILGEHLTLLRAAAVVIATAGVVLAAVRPGARFDAANLKPALHGVASGGLFAVASVGFRGGILALDDGPYYLRAATTLTWSLGIQTVLLGAWLAVFARPALTGSLRLWRQSLLAGLLGACASQLWFLGFSLTAAANVRTLGLVEVLFAQGVARRVFGQRATPRELGGMALVVAGVALLLATAAAAVP
jgi:drug/metabolite transporter (DMT)-like permease